jgi:ubiquinone/menaquinone biosynthesis C-methylase UbiE
LNLGPRSKILEVGCGLGQDAKAIARMIDSREYDRALDDDGGFVVAVDASRKMLKEASIIARNSNCVQYCLADARQLPFGDGVFDGARADRVLQHISESKIALGEMIRTVREGGRVVVYEPDWGTFIISSGKREVSRTMIQLFGDTFPSGWIGRQLPGLFRKERLRNIQVEPQTFFTCDLPLASQVFDLANNARRAVEMGCVLQSQAVEWLEELERARRQGCFFCSYTGFLVCGEKGRM